MGSVEEPIPEVEVLIVGAGFGSYTLFNRLRNLGYEVRIFEKAPSAGGIWHWNCYPGARVDSDTPIYQLFDKELWEDFTFKERYPGWKELRSYFQHIDKKWNVSAHTQFNTCVDTADFDEEKQKWLVENSDGSKIYCRWFIPCLGFASKHYSPPVAGLSNFKGEIYHTAKWPQHGVNLRGKNIVQIGTGASGIQCSQELGQIAKHLTLFQRTPNLCLPMRQRKLDREEEQKKKDEGKYDKAFEDARHTFAGFTYTNQDRNTFDDTPEEREKFYESLWQEGGFRFWLNNYADLFSDEKANDEAYKFWHKKVTERIKTPYKRELLAPEKPIHPFGTKRPSLEQNFYEVIDQDNVTLVDINTSPITSVVEHGVVTKDGLIEADVIVLATGFDSVTGSLAQLNIRGKNDQTIAQHWKDGTKTAMGIAINGFPNMFFLYGPQAPTAFSNGPSCTQFQAEFVEKFFKQIKEEGITRVEATQATEDDWYKRMHETWDGTLFPRAKSWYQGSNIPGKRVEPLNWAGGMVPYVEALNKSIENNYQGWTVAKGAA